MKSEELIYVTIGSKIILKNKAYKYKYAFFSFKRPMEYLYSYAYQEQQQWCSQEESYSAKNWLDGDFIFDREYLPEEGEGFVCLDAELTESAKTAVAEQETELSDIWEILAVEGSVTEEEALSKRAKQFALQEDVQEEIRETIAAIRKKRGKDSLVFFLLTDTHYVLNGNWEMTAETMESVQREIKPDGVIHLGDLTDGILDKKICWKYSRRVLNRILGWNVPFYMAIGNHDVNYFKKNPEILSKTEQYDYYLRDTVSGELKEGQLWYHADFPEQKLRLLFLHSYDNGEILRYGFTQEELDWVKEKLEQLPETYQVILFSHDAPLARLDYWAKDIRNGEKLTELLDQWNREHEGRILAFIHGHTHADNIYEKRTFPIVSVGCSKIEYFEDKKPEGAVTSVRLEDEVSQELWDTMIVNARECRIDFVRFGAGTDRCICTAKKAGSEKDMQKQKTKIWAHRGASGYAPENTLEAFALAEKLGADGVELDVQFTKDRQLVVIHDERIDRVSDGKGLVTDYTLEELKKFHFNKTHPEYENAGIPTLREVLELLAPTGLTVNIELKTGINFYPGIEKSVAALVEELEMQDKVIYSSFNHESVMRIKEIVPNAQTGFLYCDGTLDMPEYAQKYGVDALHPARYNIKYPGFVEACRSNDRKLHVWTVNEKREMEQMLQLGVDAIITNYPDRAYEVIYGEKLAVPQPPKKPEPSKPEVVISQPEPSKSPETVQKRKKNPLLHLAGVTYSKIRKVFVAIDRVVQKAAGR